VDRATQMKNNSTFPITYCVFGVAVGLAVGMLVFLFYMIQVDSDFTTDVTQHILGALSWAFGLLISILIVMVGLTRYDIERKLREHDEDLRESQRWLQGRVDLFEERIASRVENEVEERVIEKMKEIAENKAAELLKPALDDAKKDIDLRLASFKDEVQQDLLLLTDTSNSLNKALEYRAEANAAFDEYRYLDALMILERFERLPNLPSDLKYSLYNARAANLNAVEEYSKAIQNAELALSYRDDNVAAYVNMASAHNGLSEFDAAISYCEKAKAIAPRLAPVYRHWAYALDHLNKRPEAEKMYATAIKLDPDYATRLCSRAEHSIYTAFYRAASYNLESAINLDKPYSEKEAAIYILLAAALSTQKDKRSEAIETLRIQQNVPLGNFRPKSPNAILRIIDEYLGDEGIEPLIMTVKQKLLDVK
jgi:tetratricopeptide (TPR) repeat protein